MLRHNKYGVMGDNASPGKLTFERYLQSPVFEGNVIAGGDRARYPMGNQFIAAEMFDAQFDGAGSFRQRGSPQSGADVARIERAVGREVN